VLFVSFNNVLRSYVFRDVDILSEAQDEQLSHARFLKQIEVNQTLTALYLLVEVGRWKRSKGEDMTIRATIGLWGFHLSISMSLTNITPANLGPSLLLLLTQMIGKLRWEDSSEPSCVPRQRVCCLCTRLGSDAC